MPLTFEERLNRYAALLVYIGVNLQAGQRLLISTDLECAPLARLITKHAYQAGAPLVNVIWNDALTARVRFQHAALETLSTFPQWRADLWRETAERGDAFLHVTSDDPTLLADIDPDLIDRERLGRQGPLRPFTELMRRNAFAWCRAAAPSAAWASRVFPALPADEAVARLWDHVFTANRVDEPDPVQAWRDHLQALARRAEILNERRYRTVHFRGPGTDLNVGLADTHLWVGGASPTPAGIFFAGNLPTEELFTAPHRTQVSGTVRATKPLSLSGTLVRDLEVRFKDGRIVSTQASEGEAALQRALDTDEGARYLGEVALVSTQSPVAGTGTLFLDSLYDENAACHLAFGFSFSENFERGPELNLEEIAALGGNDSLTHVDFMIGSADVEVDGIAEDGSRQPLIRGGRWAF
ncbi:aminopeptidase [Deinococcus sp. HMF7620]|uniref:Aminopeptidase n=1 Tax=Deinococcus arboris TaxID=2682977 RepID=A0A7C9IFF9_9DEIO|nr:MULTISPECIES: aminopeptidase [Deinococcus]MBZ9752839.1 aminopeptidase [Deinococcus betulae]MVN89406.1 aminopeptidase [Deinococcus arboris]